MCQTQRTRCFELLTLNMSASSTTRCSIQCALMNHSKHNHRHIASRFTMTTCAMLCACERSGDVSLPCAPPLTRPPRPHSPLRNPTTHTRPFATTISTRHGKYHLVAQDTPAQCLPRPRERFVRTRTAACRTRQTLIYTTISSPAHGDPSTRFLTDSVQQAIPRQANQNRFPVLFNGITNTSNMTGNATHGTLSPHPLPCAPPPTGPPQQPSLLRITTSHTRPPATSISTRPGKHQPYGFKTHTCPIACSAHASALSAHGPRPAAHGRPSVYTTDPSPAHGDLPRSYITRQCTQQVTSKTGESKQVHSFVP